MFPHLYGESGKSPSFASVGGFCLMSESQVSTKITAVNCLYLFNSFLFCPSIYTYNLSDYNISLIITSIFVLFLLFSLLPLNINIG